MMDSQRHLLNGTNHNLPISYGLPVPPPRRTELSMWLPLLSSLVITQGPFHAWGHLTGAILVLKRTSGDPDFCLLPLSFSKSSRKQNFYRLVSLNLEDKEIVSAVARNRPKSLLPGKMGCCVRNVGQCGKQVNFWEVSPRTLDCLPDRCLCQSTRKI